MRTPYPYAGHGLSPHFFGRFARHLLTLARFYGKMRVTKITEKKGTELYEH